jgi:hypothetical protein
MTSKKDLQKLAQAAVAAMAQGDMETAKRLSKIIEVVEDDVKEAEEEDE